MLFMQPKGIVILLFASGLALICMTCDARKPEPIDLSGNVYETGEQFADICRSAEEYRFHEGCYPKNLDDLIVSKHWNPRSSWSKPTKTPKGCIIKDRWQLKPIKYVCPGMSHDEPYGLYCFGPNGIDDEGQHDDITAQQILDIERAGKIRGFVSISPEGKIAVLKRLTKLWDEGKIKQWR